jgi:hypothetical protein
MIGGAALRCQSEADWKRLIATHLSNGRRGEDRAGNCESEPDEKNAMANGYRRIIPALRVSIS